MEVRFKTYLHNDIRNICGGRIQALRIRQRSGTLSIGSGKEPGEISPEEIPGRRPSGEEEMVADIMGMLRRRSTPEMPLGDLFLSILRGEGTRVQRSRFGHSRADLMRKTIVQVIERYARQTENWHLLRLLDRFRDFSGSRADTVRPTPPSLQKPPKPMYPPDEQDYRSIVDVLEKHGRSVSMAILGKLRRRWLERPPRDPSSPYANRLADVLARMVKDGVIRKVGVRYVPGSKYARYLEPVEIAARQDVSAL